MRRLRIWLGLLLLALLSACGGGGGDTTTTGAGSVTTQALFTTAPATLTLSVGAASQQYAIAGGTAPYSVNTTKPGVAVGGINGATLTIGAIASGTADISVIDSLGTKVTTSVTVESAASQALYTTAPSGITVAVGTSPTYTVGGGVGPYTSTSNNTSVATASVTGSTLTVNGLATGSANVVLRDAAGATVIVAVTVPPAGTVALFTTAPPAIYAAIGSAAQQYTIGGGTGPYTATSSNSSVVSVTSPGAGNSISLTGLNAGSANIVVRDSVGTTVTIAVTVIQPSTVLQLLPATLSISEKDLNPIKLYVYGGTGTYTGFTDNLTSTSVSIAGSVMTIGAGSSTNRCVTPAVGQTSVPVTLTVIDSAGASATSVLTIVDEATCP